MAKTKGAVANTATAEKKYMKPSEIVTFGIGLFGVALLTGWMPDYTMTFFADFAFKGKGFDSTQLAHIIPIVFGVAGIVGALCELIIGVLVDRTRTPLGKVKPGSASVQFRSPSSLCLCLLHQTHHHSHLQQFGCL